MSNAPYTWCRFKILSGPTIDQLFRIFPADAKPLERKPHQRIAPFPWTGNADLFGTTARVDLRRLHFLLEPVNDEAKALCQKQPVKDVKVVLMSEAQRAGLVWNLQGYIEDPTWNGGNTFQCRFPGPDNAFEIAIDKHVML